MRDTDDRLTKRQREYIDTVIEACNATKYRTISPGLCGSCAECRSAFGFKPSFELDYWQERDRLFVGLKVSGTNHYAVEAWDEDAAALLEDLGADDCYILGKLIDEKELQSLLEQHVKDCDIEIPDEVLAEAMNEEISNGSLFDEGGFSHQDCDVCGCHLGGDRFAAHGHDEDGGIIHYDICVDCLHYLANGDVPERPYE